MTTKKMYEKPSMKVFPLRQKPKLLVGSNGDIPNNDNYTPGDNPFTF